MISVLETRLWRSGLPIEGLKWEQKMEKKVRKKEKKLGFRKYAERQEDLRS